jgi:hypothetical protein
MPGIPEPNVCYPRQHKVNDTAILLSTLVQLVRLTISASAFAKIWLPAYVKDPVDHWFHGC